MSDARRRAIDWRTDKTQGQLDQGRSRVRQPNLQVYGADKVRRELRRGETDVARCTVKRLMRKARPEWYRAWQGRTHDSRRCEGTMPARPDRSPVQDTTAEPAVDQRFHVRFDMAGGFVYVVFVINVCARRLVGGRVSSSLQTDLVLDALEQALYERQPEQNALIRHSDRGSQCVSIKCSERLAEAGIAPSVESKRDSYGNALAETINGLYKTEVIHRRAP